MKENNSKIDKDDECVDVALWSAGIRTHYWMKQYEQLEYYNKSTFKIFYCGQRRPTPEEKAQFPENLVYIYCDMPGITPHAEIARRFAVNSNAKYVMMFNDDLYCYPGVLDHLITEIESHEQEMVVGTAFRAVMEGQATKPSGDRFINLGLDRNGCLGFMCPLIKREFAEKIGGLDKRFKGSCFDGDYYLRMQSYEDVGWKTVEKAKVAEDMSQQFPSLGWGERASAAYGDYDRKITKDIWAVDLCNFKGQALRKQENIFFEDSELEFEIG